MSRPVESQRGEGVCGYANTIDLNAINPPFTPSPWLGSPGVIFIGTSTNWDAGAIKLDNPSNQPLTVDSVTVDIGPTLGINPWSPVTVRRQSFWDRERLKIRESLARLVFNVMRPADGAASGDWRLSVV